MSDHMQDLLRQLDSHLANRAFEDARQTAQELREIYQDRRNDEQERLRRSRAVALDRTISVQESATLSGHSYTDGSTRFSRAAVLTMVSAVTETHEELESQGQLEQYLTKIRSAIEDLQVSENELTEQATDSESALQSVTAPPTVAITGTSQSEVSDTSGIIVTLTLIIKNVGDRTARNIQVSSVGTHSSLTVGTDSIAELRPDGSGEATLEISASEAGSYSLGIQATPEEGSSAIVSKTLTLGTETPVGTETNNPETERTQQGDNFPMWLIGGGVAGGVSVAALMKWLYGDD